MDESLNTVLMGKRLRACRNARKLTMGEFSEVCGISERYLADIERGQKAPKLSTFVQIVNAAGVSADYLLQDSLNAAEDGRLLSDTLNTLPPEQKKLLQSFVLELAETLREASGK
ncbi:XRE family transcriptional regulator [Butyricicoccus sp. 1XD8-22]|nr:XRE family transcriptional regulator [Butyricicoccus sp. 1XD8-22]